MSVSPAEADALRSRSEGLRSEAVGFLEKGEFAASLALYDESLATARRTGDATFVDWIYSCRAAAAAEAGPAEGELVELKRILLRGRGDQTAFRAAYTAARIYELKRDFRKAAFYARLARQHAAEIGDPLLLAGAESTQGTLLAVDSRFEEAAECYRRALEVSAPPARVSALARALWQDNLGYCLIALDRTSEGLPLVHDALETIERAGATAHTVFPLMDLCFGYLKGDRYEEARYFGEACLERAPLCGDDSVERNVLYLLGEASHLGGDEDSARDYFDRLASRYPDFRNLRAYLEVFDFRNVINLRS
ncbi:MAG: tetratricopeptide repeat protein [Thermoanaerobaculia bacterium]